MKSLILLGCGGHARSVCDIALRNGFNNIVFIDNNAKENEKLFGFSVLTDIPPEIDEKWDIFCASGNNYKRKEQFQLFSSQQSRLKSIISGNSSMGYNVKIGNSCFVGNFSHVGPRTTIGNCAIINNGAIVEHDCHVEDFAHISVGAVVAGSCRVGSYSLVGAGAVVRDGVEIGSKILVGAGAVVCKSLSIPGTYIGNPARLQK